MTVYVDNMRDTKTGQWCHMGTDNLTDVSELHEIAEKIGLKPEWFQDHPMHPHYDLRASKRMAAIRNGAIPVSGFEYIGKCSRYGRWVAGGKVGPMPTATPSGDSVEGTHET